MSSGITIRPAIMEDAIRIHEINERSLGYVFPLEKTRERLGNILSRSTDRVFVACREGHVIGFIHGSDYECIHCEPLKEIVALGVEPAFQGEGAGRMLLQALEEWARRSGCAGVRLVSGFDRTGAHRFYLRCGYTDRKDQKNFIKLF